MSLCGYLISTKLFCLSAVRIDPGLLPLTLTGWQRLFTGYRLLGPECRAYLWWCRRDFVGFRSSLGAATNVWLTDHVGLNIAIGADLEQ